MHILGVLRRTRFLTGLVLAITIGAALCIVFYLNLLYSMQLQSSDFLFKGANINQSKESEGKVVVVGIDDKSLEQLGHISLWLRSYYAHLIDALAESETRIVVFDVLFSEPATGDEQLATSIRNARNVILPLAYKPSVTNYEC